MKKVILIISFFILIEYSYSQWTTYNTGANTQHFDVFFINQNTGWSGGDYSKVFKTTNCGVDWNLVYSPSTSNIIYCIFFTDPLKGWAGTFSGTVLKTTNGGLNWNETIAANGKRIYDIFFINEFTGWCVGGEGTLRKTTNGGISWFNPGITFQSTAYSVFFINSQTGFACGINFYCRSLDGGNSWINTASYNSSFTKVQFFNDNTGWIFGYRNYNNNPASLYILKTNNTGVNWNAVYADTVSSMNFTMVNDGYFLSENCGYVVGIEGYVPEPMSRVGFVRKTTNGGINWSNVSYGYASNIEAIKFVNTQICFAVGAENSSGGKIFKTTNGGETTVNNINSHLPKDFSLSQNYPNPFNPTTNIKFQIPDLSFQHALSWNPVKLIVYDILGKEIATLVNEKLKPGEYEISFDAANLPSGIYFYTLSTEDFKETKKMILLK